MRVFGSGYFTVLLPVRDKHVTAYPGFSYNVEIGIFFCYSFTPVGHHFEIRIRMCVLTYAIDTCILNPPDTALYQISSYMAVTLVKVRHTFAEPAVYYYFLRIV